MSRIDKLIAFFVVPALAAGCAGEQGERTPESGTEASREAPEPACEPGQSPTTGPVTISLDEAGGIDVEPSRVKVARGQGSVEFTSERPFVVIFQEKEGVLPTQAATAAAKARSKAPMKVNPEAECGTYKYSVAVWDSASQKPVGIDPPLDIVPTGSGSDTTTN